MIVQPWIVGVAEIVFYVAAFIFFVWVTNRRS